MKCPHCGGSMIGDGYTSPITCENAETPMDFEPDADPIYCDEEEEYIPPRILNYSEQIRQMLH